MLKFALSLIIAMVMMVSAKAESQLKPFDVLWHCDRVTNSVVEMATEIGESVRTNGPMVTDEKFANQVFVMIGARESMTLKKMEYDRTPQTPFYSATLYDKIVRQYQDYVVKQRLDFGTVNSAIVGTYVFRSCINENLSIKNNP